MDTCNCKSKATISTIGGVEKLHSSTCSKETKWKWPKKEEPKPACDHIVGVAGWVDQYCCDGDKVNMSHLIGNNTLLSLKDVTKRFYFCPKEGCGKPIDWEAIELSLKK